MYKEIRVLILDDDPFSRGWMEFLLRRDLRIRVIHDVGDKQKLEEFTADDSSLKINLVLVDTDLTYGMGWLDEMLAALHQMQPAARLLFCGSRLTEQQMEDIVREPGFSGYLLKNEIGDSLSWAAALCADGNFILTPGALKALPRTYVPPRSLLTVRKPSRKDLCLSKKQYKTARMAFVLSMERRDLADELGITVGTCHGSVSELYELLGLEDFQQAIDDGKLPKHFHQSHPAIQKSLQYIIDIAREAKKNERRKKDHSTSKKVKDKLEPKAPDKETLSFHLLTIPEIDP